MNSEDGQHQVRVQGRVLLGTERVEGASREYQEREYQESFNAESRLSVSSPTRQLAIYKMWRNLNLPHAATPAPKIPTKK